MKREIGTGIQDFESFRVNRDFYVDKTAFIREWWKGRDAVIPILEGIAAWGMRKAWRTR